MNATNQNSQPENPFKIVNDLKDIAPELWKSKTLISADRIELSDPAASKLAELGKVEQIGSGLRERYTPDPAA